jgi:hypothetical protein
VFFKFLETLFLGFWMVVFDEHNSLMTNFERFARKSRL